MKKLIAAKIISIILLAVLVFGDPNDLSVLTSYKKIDDNTMEETVITTYYKSELEAEKAELITKRDSRKLRIDKRYQPRIDEIDAKLNLFR